ncbi:MAG: DUF1329 domain-containing protein [Marinicellaceae bacterium]
MNLVKQLLILALTFSLVMGCSKPEDRKSSEDQAMAEKQAAEAEAQKMAAEAKDAAEAEMKAAKKRAAEEAEKLAAEAKAAAEADAAKKAAEAEAMAAKEAAEMAAKAKAMADKEAAEMAAKAKAMADKEAAEMAAKAKEMADKEAADAERMAAEKLAAAEAEAAAAANAAATAKAFDMSADLGDKTPVGAQKSGNASGTIPAWTGGITSPPAGYAQGDHHQDPFASDQIKFTIDSSNYSQYADNLSVGQKAMFDKYDTYKMNVYQTRRSASFPQRIYEKTIENGKTGKLIAGGEGVTGVAEGFPFPNPQNAYELILNHKLKFKGSGGVRYNNQVAPTASGRYTVVKLKEELLGKYYTEGNTIDDIDNILLYFYQVVESPARLAGRILLVHETMNQTETPRQAWIYNPGQRRVRRAPNVAYDNPGTASDGLRTNDMTDMFNGAMDRFDWKVVGKKEMYVPYNSYKVHSGDLDYSDIVKPGHLNPDLMRYEIHRMWVVEATLKDGVRHINSRRTFYLDEDSYQIMLIDHYDSRGNIWRFSEAHSINYYDVPTFWSTVETHHDLRSGRYVAVGLDNKDPVNTFNVPLSEANYTPQALRKRGRR